MSTATGATQGSTGTTQGAVGSTADAVTALTAALVQAAESKPKSTADPAVSAAFALGWHMAELYRLDRDKANTTDLPGLGSLGVPDRIRILIEQIKTNANKLSGPVAQAEADAIDLAELDPLKAAPPNEGPIYDTHIKILGDLTATDFKLGKAYGLGRALADTCRPPQGDSVPRSQLEPHRVVNLLRWLDDLASVFPDHAANSVSKSLMRWRDAAYPDQVPKAPKFGWKRLAAWWKGDLRYRKKPPSSIEDKDLYALRRQGEIWRSLLSGEKLGTDMLEINNYLDAVRNLASRIGAIVRGVTSRMPIVSVAIVALLAGGIYLIAAGSSSQIVGGATSVLVAFGLTWKGVGSTTGKLVGKLEQPLWGAVLDDAIADAITVLPTNDTDSFGRRRAAAERSGKQAS